MATIQQNLITLFTKFNKDIIIYVLIYVDGFIITGNSEQEINSLIKHLNQEFTMKDLGNLSYFLDIEVKKSIQYNNSTESKDIHNINSAQSKNALS